MTKHLQKKLVSTEASVMDVLDMSADRLFWARVDVGREYLLQKYGEKKRDLLQYHPDFWVWWRFIWHLNDKDMLDYMHEKRGRITQQMYTEGQLVRSMHKYQLTYNDEQRYLKEAPAFKATIQETTKHLAI